MRQLTLSKVLFLCALPLLALWVWTEHPASNDDLLHHQIARWSFEYPHLLVDIWGRAGFTLLHALPAQLGLAFDQLFSIALTLATGWIVARQLRPQGQTIAALGAAFTITQTYFFQLAFGTMTETVYAFALALGFWLWRSGHLMKAALAFSWTGATRMEGMPLLIIIGAAFILEQVRGPEHRRQGWLRVGIAFCLLGLWPLLWNLVLSARGNFEQPFALLTSNVFVTTERNVYGSGSWYKFIVLAPQIFTLPTVICLLLGLRKAWRAGLRTEISYFAAFYALQSILWGFGLFRTAGYERFFASIAPLGGLIAAFGFWHLCRFKGLRRWSPGRVAYTALGVSLLHGIIWCAGWQWHFQSNYSAVARAVEDTRSLGMDRAERPLLVSNDVYAPYLLDLDPFDPAQRLRLRNLEDPQQLKPGTIILFAAGHQGQPQRILSFYQRPQAPEVEARIEAALRGDGERGWYIHLLENPLPGFQEISDHSILSRFGSPPDDEDWPFWVKVLQRVEGPR